MAFKRSWVRIPLSPLSADPGQPGSVSFHVMKNAVRKTYRKYISASGGVRQTPDRAMRKRRKVMGKLGKKNKNTKEGKDKQLKQQLAALERKNAAKKK